MEDKTRIQGIIFEHGTNDYGLWDGFNLTEDEENIITEILTRHDTEGCSIRGTLSEIAKELDMENRIDEDKEDNEMGKDQMKTINEILKRLDKLEKFYGDSSKKVAKDLQIKEGITVAGITWSKFAEDSEGNAYMLADEKICDMDFGKNNDWRESPIRKKLNEELYQKIVAELGEDALVTIQTDLFSHDGLRDYGKCEDMVSLLTYDLYRNNRENIKEFNNWWWLSTPDSTPSGCGSDGVQYVDSGGNVDYGWCGGSGAVRPFFILKSDIFVSCEDQSIGRRGENDSI